MQSCGPENLQLAASEQQGGSAPPVEAVLTKIQFAEERPRKQSTCARVTVREIQLRGCSCTLINS